ncbi:MAG TPA: hypothetical protein VFR06_07170 [Gallionellaceae bacterium]|nr:hypothetical protein [Gallionellaceae bacterium]
MEITCYRNPEFAHEARSLPAATYNLAHTLLSRSPSGCLFIPIRTMQFLAILDAEELVFVDGARKCWIDIAWRNFRPQQRSSLDEPVPYEAVYYHADAASLMPRLQAELPRALHELAGKERYTGEARVLKFPAPARE